ncbi:MAG: phosphoglycerate dehydrogenase [Candidatus Marinimicrobia bacterium]|nr:phosphoglycerate dehydrogenase [Candidatus Neomarinimicrobiota bacterium]|tara:strand:- start:92 stop:1669 length:1578 start_codon:yes stop_codon:yes gene_type:complete
MKVLVSDPITKAGLSILKKAKLDVVYLPEANLEEKTQAARKVQAWVVRSGTKISAEAIKLAKELVVIGRAGVGIDNININAATRNGVVVMNTPDVNTISAAEHTIALILAISRNIHIGHIGLEKGHWERHKLVGTELKNKTLGIVGLGKIGQQVMERCLSFGMEIIGYDPYLDQGQFNEDEVKIVDLDKLTGIADYITIHVPATNTTKDLFNYDRLSKMKRNSRIINVSRGGIVNEKDLAKILIENKISGAAIDVFESEPIDNTHPLVGLPNVLLTPHLGASTQEAKEGVSRAICSQIRDYLINEKVVSAVNLRASDFSILKEIKPYVELSEILGQLHAQINHVPIYDVNIQCSGILEETRPLLLSFLKGLLEKRVPDRINYINAETIAKDLGINIAIKYTNNDTNYTNLISTSVIAKGKKQYLDGSIFDKDRPRLVKVNNYEMEVKLHGTMLFIENKDMPGVIGHVGSFLGSENINIAAYLLSRSGGNGMAFAVVRVDNELSEQQLNALSRIDHIRSIKQIRVS